MASGVIISQNIWKHFAKKSMLTRYYNVDMTISNYFNSHRIITYGHRSCIHHKHRVHRKQHIWSRNDNSTHNAGNGWFPILSRAFSTDQEPKDSVTSSPFNLVEQEISTLCRDIKQIIHPLAPDVKLLSHYQFDGKGKAFRPMVVMLAAKSCNIHHQQHKQNNEQLLLSQKTIAYISEMIHTASLIHDDVIDQSAMRRGRPSVQHRWGQRKAILAGNFIISAACVALARIGNIEVVQILSKVLEDLVSGEFMQLGSKEDETERFNHYLQKTYKKTASLLANSCKAVAVLSGVDEDTKEHAFQYGRNIGIAFQLVDDLLDFIATEAQMGKPTAADLKLGLATAPVLFAAHQHPELNAMIMRRFKEEGDVEKAWKLIADSDGIGHTKYLAEQHCNEAVRHIRELHPSNEREALVTLTQHVLHRLK